MFPKIRQVLFRKGLKAATWRVLIPFWAKSAQDERRFKTIKKASYPTK